MKNAVIYARYSSDRQTEQSIEGQLRVVNKYAEDNDYIIIDVYVDRATTGTNDNRAAFQKMIHDSFNRKFEYVLVYKLDRFARNRFDSAFNKATLKKNGVRVISATESISDSPEGIILESMLEGYAEYYSAELSQKVKRGQYETIQKGTFLGGTMLYGYKSVNKVIEIDEEESIIVRRMFNLYANGSTAKEVAQILNNDGLRNKQGRPFVVNSIMNLLKNEKYNGVLNYGEYRIEDYYPKIIDNETFQIVKNRIEKNRRSPARMKAYQLYRLSGKLHCGYCKSLMTGEAGTGKQGKIHNYYKCFGRKKNNGCNKKTVKKESLENLVADLALRHVLSEDKLLTTIEGIVTTHNEAIKENPELSLLKQDYNTNDKYIANIMKAIKNGIITETTQTELLKLESRKRELLESIVIAEAKKENGLTKEKVLGFFKTFIEEGLNDEDAKTSIIESLVNKVILYDDKIIIVLKNRDDKTIEANIEDIESLCSDLTQDTPPISHNPNPNIIITKDFVVVCYRFDNSKNNN